VHDTNVHVHDLVFLLRMYRRGDPFCGSGAFQPFRRLCRLASEPPRALEEEQSC
jgi:hypothetical protein